MRDTADDSTSLKLVIGQTHTDFVANRDLLAIESFARDTNVFFFSL